MKDGVECILVCLESLYPNELQVVISMQIPPFFQHVFIVTLLRAKLCRSLTSTCFNFPLCRKDAALVFVVTLFLTPFLYFSYFPFLLLFSSLVCLFLLKFQSFEKPSYSKILVNWGRVHIHIFYLPFCLFLALNFYLSSLIKTLFQEKQRKEKLGIWEMYP